MLRSLLATVFLLAVPLAAATNPSLAAGLPATTRPWSGPDYERAAEILGAGKVPLPRLADPRGAALVKRITSLDSLAPQRDKTLPASSRLQEFFQVQGGAAKLMNLYVGAQTEKGGYQPELARLAAFVLFSSAQGEEIIEEMVPTLPRDDKYATRMAGVKKANEGLTQVFLGAEQMLSEKNGFSAAETSILLEAMARTLPRLKKGFPSEVRIEMRKKLAADKARFKTAADSRRLDGMLAELGKP
jgi:hypothetical protein